MYIHEAVKKAMEIDGYIAYVSDGRRIVLIKPTNTRKNCILCAGGRYSEFGWQPKAEHLITDKWEVVPNE